MPGPGAVSCAPPEPLTAAAAPHDVWQSRANAPLTGCGGFAGSLQERSTASEPPPTAVAVRLEGTGGPLLSTTTGGLCALVVLPAALVTSSVRVCEPSWSSVMLRLSDRQQLRTRGAPECRTSIRADRGGEWGNPGATWPTEPRLTRSEPILEFAGALELQRVPTNSRQGLITRRSRVRIPPPLCEEAPGNPGVFSLVGTVEEPGQ